MEVKNSPPSAKPRKLIGVKRFTKNRGAVRTILANKHGLQTMHKVDHKKKVEFLLDAQEKKYEGHASLQGTQTNCNHRNNIHINMPKI